MLIASQIRNLGRYRQILTVLIQYGFADFVRHTGLAAVVSRSLGVLGTRGRAEAEFIRQSKEVRLRLALEELGPTFIKLGQVLSTRRDLVPDEVAAEFAKLQSDCPMVPYEQIRERLEGEFPGRVDEIFASIEEKPIAAASMAQAHRATLASGEQVVLKILRPGIEETLLADMEILRFIASVVDDYFENMGFEPVEVADEFARELKREIDLLQEGRSTENLKNAFSDDPEIDFPKVYWEATTKRVLCIEEVHGTLLARADLDTMAAETRRKVVENGSRAVFKMTLEMGFFHADPHPGNIFVKDDGAIVFIDCGMVGHVDLETRMHIAELVYGVTKNDADEVMHCALALADMDPDKIDIRRARSDVQQMVDQFVGVPMDRIDLGQLLDDFFQTLRRYGLQCPADVVLLIKAMSTIEGVGAKVDPEFDMVTFAHPYIAHLLRERYSPKAIMRRFKNASTSYLEVMETIPKDVSSIVRKLRRNEFKMDFNLGKMEELIETAESATDNVAHSLLISAIVVSSAILVHAAPDDRWSVQGILGLLGFSTALFMGAGLLFNSWRHRRGSRAMLKRARKRRR
ncbi:MAG: AarF/ABC1/UbiB kinase family protein [Planctomycetota bacterium]|nr:AarF/ABC1/UbiB kinase family protein [Planctomycetota bacterium]